MNTIFIIEAFRCTKFWFDGMKVNIFDYHKSFVDVLRFGKVRGHSMVKGSVKRRLVDLQLVGFFCK